MSIAALSKLTSYFPVALIFSVFVFIGISTSSYISGLLVLLDVTNYALNSDTPVTLYAMTGGALIGCSLAPLFLPHRVTPHRLLQFSVAAGAIGWCLALLPPFSKAATSVAVASGERVGGAAHNHFFFAISLCSLAWLLIGVFCSLSLIILYSLLAECLPRNSLFKNLIIAELCIKIGCFLAFKQIGQFFFMQLCFFLLLSLFILVLFSEKFLAAFKLKIFPNSSAELASHSSPYASESTHSSATFLAGLLNLLSPRVRLVLPLAVLHAALTTLEKLLVFFIQDCFSFSAIQDEAANFFFIFNACHVVFAFIALHSSVDRCEPRRLLTVSFSCMTAALVGFFIIDMFTMNQSPVASVIFCALYFGGMWLGVQFLPLYFVISLCSVTSGPASSNSSSTISSVSCSSSSPFGSLVSALASFIAVQACGKLLSVEVYKRLHYYYVPYSMSFVCVLIIAALCLYLFTRIISNFSSSSFFSLRRM